MLRRFNQLEDYLYLFTLASTYSIGESMQSFEIGPSFLRWHLSDFGFSAAISLLIYIVFGFKPWKGLLFGAILALFYEVEIQGFVGKADPIDILAILSGYLLGLILYHFDYHSLNSQIISDASDCDAHPFDLSFESLFIDNDGCLGIRIHTVD